jgi:hypothetical protein
MIVLKLFTSLNFLINFVITPDNNYIINSTRNHFGNESNINIFDYLNLRLNEQM